MEQAQLLSDLNEYFLLVEKNGRRLTGGAEKNKEKF